MFDSIKLHVYADTRPFEDYAPGQLTKIEDHFNRETGYPGKKAWLKNLCLSRTNAGLVITGSIAKLVQGHNVHALSPEGMRAALLELSGIVGADLDEADVWSLEISETLIMDEPVYKYFQCLQDLSRFERDLLGNGSTVRFRQNTKSFQFYNKGSRSLKNLPKEFEGLNLLRAEFKYKRKLRKNLKGYTVKGRDLYNESFIKQMVRHWYTMYCFIYKSRVPQNFNCPGMLKTPKDLTTALAIHAVRHLGADNLKAMIQERRTSLSPSNYDRMVKLIRDLSQHTDFTTTDSLVDELDRKMLEIARKYCPGEMFENEIQGETTPFLGIEQ